MGTGQRFSTMLSRLVHRQLAARCTFAATRIAIKPLPMPMTRVRFFAAGPEPLSKQQVQERVLATVKAFEKVDPSAVSATSSFKDLGLDSLDAVEVVMAIEDEFGIEITDEDAEKINTVKQAVDFIAALPEAK